MTSQNGFYMSASREVYFKEWCLSQKVGKSMTRAYTDGACRGGNPGETSAAFAVDIDGLWYTHKRYLGPEPHTNNFAEYQGVIDLLKWAEAEKKQGLDIHCDSQLIVKQINGEWAVKHEEIKPLHALATALKIRGNHTLTWVRGHNGDEGNELVDRLCNEALDEEFERRKNVQG